MANILISIWNTIVFCVFVLPFMILGMVYEMAVSGFLAGKDYVREFEK